MTAPTITAGRGFSVSGSGNTSTYTIYFPERYGKVPWLSAEFYAGTTSIASLYPYFSGGYTVPTSGPSFAQFQAISSNGGGVTTVTAYVGPIGTAYFEIEAEIGF